MIELASELRAKLRRVRLFITDVDGVLTDGTLHYGPQGETIKKFHVRDGMGLRLLIDSGIEVAVITARTSKALDRRMTDLRIEHYYPGRADKTQALDELLAKVGVPADQAAFVGDDVLDLGVLGRVGVAITVSDGHPAVKSTVDWVTTAAGGHGAVREIADAILECQNKLERAISTVEPRSTRSASPAGFKVVIPSRYGAMRLPGKPLREIAGRPMVAHVWDRGVESGAEEVLVAADDDRIIAAVESFGGTALMTSPNHLSGTDRIAEVADRKGWSNDTIVVNLQGDEPCMDPGLVQLVAAALQDHRRAGIATVATRITEATELFDPNVVKVVIDDHDYARYFSRAPIPWVRGSFSIKDPCSRCHSWFCTLESESTGNQAGRHSSELPNDLIFHRHLGLYAYRVGVLRRLAHAPQAPSETAESLEQLRALMMGIDIHVTIAEKAPVHGVDTEQDLIRVEQELSAARTL